MLASLLQRTKVSIIGCALFSGYLWTGAVAKLWIAEQTPGQPIFGDSSLHHRPIRGHARAGANIPFSRSLGVYASLTSGSLLGPTTGNFLKGIGIGIDPETPDYDVRCRVALEQVVDKGGFNPWRERARLELAHLLARPSSISQRTFSWGDEPFEGPSWITLGLVDSDRWWVMHEPSGADPVRAMELCASILNARPSEYPLADTLRLQADLAAEHWDFPGQDSLLRDLIESCPTSPLAQQALQELGIRLPQQGRTADAAGLARRLLHRLSPADRVRLAPAVAPLQAMGEGVPAARAMLESALREAELLARDLGGHRLASADPRTPIRDALKQLPKDTGAVPGPPPVPPGFPVRSRLLAAGKALGGISVGLVPIPILAQQFPPAQGAALTAPRAPGVFTDPEVNVPGQRRPGRRGGDQNQAWQMIGTTFALRQNPSLVARSDREGNLVWSAVPPGTYGVVLRAGTWQLPNEGRDLAVTPLAAPLVVSGPGATLPDLFLCESMRPAPVAADQRPPGLRWKPVPGAATYRVSLMSHQPRWGASVVPVRCAAAPAFAPEVVWWCDGVKGTSVRLTPEHFVGPLGDSQRGGLHGALSYRWSVEARDASGQVLATAETLAPAPTVKLPTWAALRTSKQASTTRPDPLAERSRLVNALFRNDQSQFSSPFLDSLLTNEEAPATVAAKPALYPTSTSRGQGLPPRAALAMSALTVRPAGGMSASPGLAPMPGGMPPGVRPPFPVGMPQTASLPPGFAGTPPMLPSLPPGTPVRPGSPPAPIAGVAPRPSPAGAMATTLVTLETFDGGSRDRWETGGETPLPEGLGGFSIKTPLVLTPRDTPLPLPVGPGRLSVRLSSLRADLTVVLVDGQGKTTRLKLRAEAGTRSFHAMVALGEWKLQSLEIRPTTGEVVLESLTMEVPPAPGLYARAWREGTAAWIELTNLGPAPQSVTLGEPGSAITLDLASGGKARLPLPGAPASPVPLQFSGRKLEVPLRGPAAADPP